MSKLDKFILDHPVLSFLAAITSIVIGSEADLWLMKESYNNLLEERK